MTKKKYYCRKCKSYHFIGSDIGSKHRKYSPENKHGYWFGCIKCGGSYKHQSKMKKGKDGIIYCSKCGGYKFIMRRGRPY